MPEFAGVSHVSLSVRDRDASRDWYGRTLGFQPFDEVHHDAYEEWVLVHPRNRTILCLQQHRSNRGETFDPARTGGDHLGLKVDSREELDRWKAWFEQAGVEHSAIVDAGYGSVLCFRDPDRIQLEMFYREDHP